MSPSNGRRRTHGIGVTAMNTRENERLKQGRFIDPLFLPDFRVNYISIPKVGNTSLKTFLSEALDLLTVEESLAVQQDPQAIHGILRSPRFLWARSITASRQLVVFRNPVDRFISFWSDKVVGTGWDPCTRDYMFDIYGWNDQMSIVQVAESVASLPSDQLEIHVRPQIDILNRSVRHGSPVFAFALEDIGRAWGYLCGWLGIDCSRHNLAVINEGAKNCDLLDRSDRQRVEAILKQRFQSDWSVWRRLSDRKVG